jgi:hypothetical protein
MPKPRDAELEVPAPLVVLIWGKDCDFLRQQAIGIIPTQPFGDHVGIPLLGVNQIQINGHFRNLN